MTAYTTKELHEAYQFAKEIGLWCTKVDIEALASKISAIRTEAEKREAHAWEVHRKLKGTFAANQADAVAAATKELREKLETREQREIWCTCEDCGKSPLVFRGDPSDPEEHGMVWWLCGECSNKRFSEMPPELQKQIQDFSAHVPRPKRKGEQVMNNPKIDVVFDGPPSHESGRFVEVEHEGRSINAGEWVERDGLWYLQIDLRKLADQLEVGAA